VLNGVEWHPVTGVECNVLLHNVRALLSRAVPECDVAGGGGRVPRAERNDEVQRDVTVRCI
jgi:hypothetical protein